MPMHIAWKDSQFQSFKFVYKWQPIYIPFKLVWQLVSLLPSCTTFCSYVSSNFSSPSHNGVCDTTTSSSHCMCVSLNCTKKIKFLLICLSNVNWNLRKLYKMWHFFYYSCQPSSTKLSPSFALSLSLCREWRYTNVDFLFNFEINNK